MHDTSHHPFTRSALALCFLFGASACGLDNKLIGSLDDQGDQGEEGEEDDQEAGVEAGTETPGDETGDTDGGSCPGEDEAIECAAPQEVDIDFSVSLAAAPELFMTCAANVEPTADGYRVLFTHCSDVDDQPQPDSDLTLTGDWPEPEFADGDEPLTEVRIIERQVVSDGYSARWAILRPLDRSRISLLAFKGTELLVDPSYLDPVPLALDNAGCAPDVNTCAGQDIGLEYRIGFAVGEGCSRVIVADDTERSAVVLEPDSDTAYHVLVGFAKNHECEPDGDFHELMLGIVGVPG